MFRNVSSSLVQRGEGVAQEFKTFIMRGNVVDLAVGIIIGGAFKGVTTSLVKDVITPPIGLMLNNVNFESIFLSLDGQLYPTLAAAQEAGAATINVGNFVNVVIDFLITAVAVFLLIKFVNRLEDVIDGDDEEEAAPAPPPAEVPPPPPPEPSTEEKMLLVLEKISAQLDKP